MPSVTAPEVLARIIELAAEEIISPEEADEAIRWGILYHYDSRVLRRSWEVP